MFRSIVLAVVLLALVTGTALASHQTTQPDNYCTTVDVVAVVNAGYNVTATGAGRYARIRDLTTATTIIATDFGAGATTYTWTGLTAQQLPMGHQYQVQVSHTSLTTGYSTSGCLFTPPMPQAVVIERFEVVKGAFEWDATEDGLGYQVFDAQGRQWTPYIPAMSPGSFGWFSYRIPLRVRTLPYGTYILMALDMHGVSGPVAWYDYGKGEVTLGND